MPSDEEERRSLYQGRVVVVTGARKGVGWHVAKHFLDERADVVGISRGEPSIEHDSYEHYSIDIGDNDAVRNAFADMARIHGKIDVLVNCAAVATSTYAFIMRTSAAEEMVSTNMLGLLYVAREAAKYMQRAGYGRIVNMGSLHSRIAPVGASMYAATKAGQAVLVEVLSKEFATYGITLNTLALSPIESDMLRASGTPDVIQKVIDGLTIPRLAEPEDVFNALDFFCSPQSSFITGQTLFLGGVHG